MKMKIILKRVKKLTVEVVKYWSNVLRWFFFNLVWRVEMNWYGMVYAWSVAKACADIELLQEKEKKK